MRKAMIMFLVLWLTGCAVGNKYQYQTSLIALPVKSDDKVTVILSVEDARPYVLNGDKPANFVGLQRGGFGNPFDVTTATGKPMTEDMTNAIADSLTNAGYRIVDAHGKSSVEDLVRMAVEEGASRIVLLRVRNWKSDIYMSITLHCDLELLIYDDRGELLAQNGMQFVEAIGGGLIGEANNSQAMTDEFAKRIGYLFNKESIRTALE